VALGGVADVLLASAVVEAERSADLAPAATGTVVRVEKDVGDAVRRGDVLAVFENASLDASAEVTASEAGAVEARVAELERLFAQGAVSARELDDLRQQLVTARIRAREASRTVGETRIVAPFEGLVAARDVRVGELVSSARRAFQVVDVRDLRVRARLPERDVARVRLGQPARLTASYDASLTATATVARVAPVVDASSGTFEVLLAIDPGQKALRPGQYVSVELEVARRDDVVVVPRDSIVWDHGQPVVFRVEPAPPEPASSSDGAAAAGASEGGSGTVADAGPKLVARRVELSLGLLDARVAEVTAGVAAGDRIVTIGQMSLKDGVRVREPSPAAAAEPAEPAEPAGNGG
jgi:membrane fusion protein (multidrug efflux system)